MCPNPTRICRAHQAAQNLTTQSWTIATPLCVNMCTISQNQAPSREERDLGLQGFYTGYSFLQKLGTQKLYLRISKWFLYLLWSPKWSSLYQCIICKQANISVSKLSSMPYPACYYIWLWLDFHFALFLVKNVILTHITLSLISHIINETQSPHCNRTAPLISSTWI